MDPELQRVEAQLTAAIAAQAEYEHVISGRARLANDLAAETARVQHLTNELIRERNDVVRLSSGVRGFLYSLIGDEQLSIEQREAALAEARLVEAHASRNHLAARVAALDARLARQSHTELIAAVAAARSEKEQALVRTNHPAGLALQDLDVRLQSIDIELLPLDEAVAAGEAAGGRLQSVIDTLDRARSERLEQADARGSAGEAQAAITVFQRAVDALGTAEEATQGFATLIPFEDRQPFVDAWIRALVSKGDRSDRLTAARAEMIERHQRLAIQLARVRARRDELGVRRAALVDERRRLLG